MAIAGFLIGHHPTAAEIDAVVHPSGVRAVDLGAGLARQARQAVAEIRGVRRRP